MNGLPLIPDLVADAIRDQVLPPALRVYPALLRLCPCQYGICQRCAAGLHNRCVERPPGTRKPRPHAYITDTAGRVPNGRLGAVWLIGRPCVWVCECPTCAHPRPQFPAVASPGNRHLISTLTWQANTLF